MKTNDTFIRAFLSHPSDILMVITIVKATFYDPNFAMQIHNFLLCRNDIIKYNVNAKSLHVLYLALIVAIKFEEIFDTYIIL